MVIYDSAFRKIEISNGSIRETIKTGNNKREILYLKIKDGEKENEIENQSDKWIKMNGEQKYIICKQVDKKGKPLGIIKVKKNDKRSQEGRFHNLLHDKSGWTFYVRSALKKRYEMEQ